MPRTRLFDVEITMRFRGTYRGHKISNQATRLKREIRRKLKSVGVRDHEVVDVRVVAHEEEGKDGK